MKIEDDIEERITLDDYIKNVVGDDMTEEFYLEHKQHIEYRQSKLDEYIAKTQMGLKELGDELNIESNIFYRDLFRRHLGHQPIMNFDWR